MSVCIKPSICLPCRKLKHPNVGQLFGIVTHRPYYALLELPVNGDLKTFLVTVKKTDIRYNHDKTCQSVHMHVVVL